MKNILFVINTEGQLLTTSSLIFERFNNDSGYEPYILQIGITGSARFQNPVKKELLTNHYIEIEVNDLLIKNKIAKLLSTVFERVFIFLEQLNINVFLSNYYKKRGSIICLAPDGNKPYYSVDKLAIGSRVKETINIYKYLNKNGLHFFKPYLLSWNYNKLNAIDEVWVTFPENFKYGNNKKVVGFKIIPDEEVLNKINFFFNFKADEVLEDLEDVIFYTNNILYEKNAYGVEIEAIKGLKEKFPNKVFYLKYHPFTPDFQIAEFKKLGIRCFSNSIPAELYIASLKKSIVVGFWSTSLMIKNPTCKFYWLHKFLIKSGYMIDTVNLTNPTDFINDVDDLNMITF